MLDIVKADGLFFSEYYESSFCEAENTEPAGIQRGELPIIIPKAHIPVIHS